MESDVENFLPNFVQHLQFVFTSDIVHVTAREAVPPLLQASRTEHAVYSSNGTCCILIERNILYINRTEHAVY